eukprot:gene22109-30344_t
MNNKKTIDAFKICGIDKRQSLLISEIIDYCKSPVTTTAMFNTVKPSVNTAKATGPTSLSSGQSPAKLPLLNEGSFVELISPIIWKLFQQLVSNYNNVSNGISMETLMSTILESECSHEHILALTKSVNNYSYKGVIIDRVLADKSILTIAQSIQLLAQNYAQSSNASSRMKVRMKCAKILLDMAAVTKSDSNNDSNWIASIIRYSLVSKEDLPHVCMELTLKVSKDTIPFLLKHISNCISSVTVQSNWLLSMLPPPILLSALDSCTCKIDSLEATISVSVESFPPSDMSDWTRNWIEVLRVANVLLLHLVFKLTAEKNSASVTAGATAFMDSVVRALEKLKSRCDSCSEETLSIVFQKAFSLSVSGLITLNVLLATEGQTASSSTSIISDGRNALKKSFMSVILSLSSWPPPPQDLISQPQRGRMFFLRLHHTFVFLLWQCNRSQDFRTYLCDENKIDLFAYLDVRKDTVINGALNAALSSIFDVDKIQPSLEALFMDLTRECCVEFAVSEHALTTTASTLWLSCLTLMLESQLIPERIGDLSTAEHIFQVMSEQVLRSNRLLDSASNKALIHPWLQRCIEAWAGWAALPHRRNGMFYKNNLVLHTQMFHSATISNIWGAFTILGETLVDESCKPDFLSVIANPPEHLMLEVSSWDVDLNANCDEYWQELLLLYAAVKYCVSVASIAQPIFAPASLTTSILHLPLTRAVQFVLLLWSAAKKLYSAKIELSPEAGDDLRTESIHYKNQLVLFEKLVRSFLETVYKLAPSFLACSPSVYTILRPSQQMRLKSELSLNTSLREEVIPQLLRPSPDDDASALWFSLCAAHPRPYVFQINTVNIIAKTFSTSALFPIYDYDVLLQEPFLLLLQLLPAMPMHTSLFNIILFITRSALLGSRVSSVPMALGMKAKTYNTQKSQCESTNNMLIVASKISKSVYVDVQEVVCIKLLIAYYHKCLPNPFEAGFQLTEPLLKNMRDRIHSLIDSLSQDNSTIVQALMKVEYLSDRNISDNSEKCATSSKSSYFAYFSDHYFAFLLGSNAVLQQFGRLLAVDIETMSSALLQLQIPGGASDAYERYEPGNTASLNMGNVVQQLEVILLQALSFLKFVIAVTKPSKSDMKIHSKMVQRLYLHDLPASISSESLKHSAEKIAQALPTLLQRGYNCLAVFHHVRVKYHIDEFSSSILQCLLRTQRAGHVFSFTLAVNRFMDLASESNKADSVGLKRLKKRLQEYFKELSPADAATKKSSEDSHEKEKSAEPGEEVEAPLLKKRKVDS